MQLDKHGSAGQIIRELRRQKNMNSQELARRVGFSQSKMSKIETGSYRRLQAKDIENIMNILEAPQTIRQQIFTWLGNHTNIDGHLRYISDFTFKEVIHFHEQCYFLRACMQNMLPALLQTSEYREAFLDRYEMSSERRQAAMYTVMRRQDMLWDKKRRFHFLLAEAALYTAPGSRLAQLAQLDRLDRLIGSNSIKIGIIPMEAGAAIAEYCNFVLFDDWLLVLSLVGAEMNIKDQLQIAQYKKVFDELDQKADYGETARRLVQKAVQYFS